MNLAARRWLATREGLMNLAARRWLATREGLMNLAARRWLATRELECGDDFDLDRRAGR